MASMLQEVSCWALCVSFVLVQVKRDDLVHIANLLYRI